MPNAAKQAMSETQLDKRTNEDTLGHWRTVFFYRHGKSKATEDVMGHIPTMWLDEYRYCSRKRHPTETAANESGKLAMLRGCRGEHVGAEYFPNY